MTRSMVLSFIAISFTLATISGPILANPIDDLLAPDNDLAPDGSDSDIINSLAPEPSSEAALLYCGSEMTLDCASEILSNDFFPVHVEEKCCKQLINMGKICNDVLVNDVLAELGLNKRASKVHNRSDHLWNKCLQVFDKY